MPDEIPDDLSELPELEPLDPAMVLHDLVTANAETMNELTQRGVQLQDSHTMVTTMLLQAVLEEILRRLGGEEAVIEVMTRVHLEIGPVLANAQSQVTRAVLTGGAGIPDGPASAYPPNRRQRRHGG